MPTARSSSAVDVVVVGAGFAGMYMLHRLREPRPVGARVRGGRRRRRHLVLEPLSGRALRRREPRVLVLVLARNSSRSGSGPSATPRSRRSCATPTTSPIASTCVATSSSTRACTARLRRGDASLGRSRTDRGDASRARYCVMATGCLSSARVPDFPGLRHLRGDRTTPATGRTRASTSPASASASIGTGSSAHPGDPGDRGAGGAADGVPAHAELQHPGAQRPARPEATQQAWKADYPRAPRAGARTLRAGVLSRSERQRRRSRSTTRSAQRVYERALGARRRQLHGRVQRPARRSARRTTPRPSSCATRSARS